MKRTSSPTISRVLSVWVLSLGLALVIVGCGPTAVSSGKKQSVSGDVPDAATAGEDTAPDDDSSTPPADAPPPTDEGPRVEPNVSCVERCGQGADAEHLCSCAEGCEAAGDCCKDYLSECKTELLSCQGRCGDAFDPDMPCQCSMSCSKSGSCCTDWKSICEPSFVSCQGKCGNPFDSKLPCQCTNSCQEHGNCCDDWEAVCAPGLLSCAGRCDDAYDNDLPCQCNLECAKYSSCCENYLGACSVGLELEWIEPDAGACDSPSKWFTVTFISDGDTFTISTGDKVRLVAVDTPEVKEMECYAKEATSYTLKKLKGKKVCLLPDPTQPLTDEFGRLLRNVYYEEPSLGGKVVLHDARLVRQGYATPHYKFIYGTSHAEQTIFMALKAEQEKAGGWGKCEWQ